ncbi:phage adaptor protein [Fodinicurvata sediminis]|uniref:phage adaptor protein n=1 Tax=Fodinicurvata sediminis TaxID=1121832 RepID=UPI0003B73C1C|nr:hypothetical protein [Fodinicurvata sediminis]
MTFLELAQMVARESGTVSGNLPSSVTNQTGRLAKIVHWTADAWRQIQNSRASWRWMRGEFEGTTTAGTARYTGASFNLNRWADWITDADSMTLYRQSDGVSDEGPILYLPWQDYRRAYDRGAQTNNRPIHYTISPSGELCFGPKPDDAYVVRGEYRKSPQKLESDGDIPEMPERFHEAIAWYGLMLLAEHDEGQLHISVAMRRYRMLMDDLMRDQLPEVSITGALA